MHNIFIYVNIHIGKCTHKRKANDTKRYKDSQSHSY